MKKHHVVICLVHITIFTSLFHDTACSQGLSEAQKQERCQNNKNRIAELNVQLKTIEAELLNVMSNQELEDKRSEMVLVRSMRNTKTKKHYDFWEKLGTIQRNYNFNILDCYREELALNPQQASMGICITRLERIIAGEIDKAEALRNKKPELLKNKADLERQIAFHMNSLIALGCDQKNAVQKEVPMNWNGTYVDEGGSVTISVSGNTMSASAANSGSSDNWSNACEWSGCEVNGNKAKCKWNCSYKDDNKTGSRHGTLEVTLNGNTISGAFYEDEPTFNWKSGTPGYTKMQKGVVWPFTMKRQ